MGNSASIRAHCKPSFAADISAVGGRRQCSGDLHEYRAGREVSYLVFAGQTPAHFGGGVREQGGVRELLSKWCCRVDRKAGLVGCLTRTCVQCGETKRQVS